MLAETRAIQLPTSIKIVLWPWLQNLPADTLLYRLYFYRYHFY